MFPYLPGRLDAVAAAHVEPLLQLAGDRVRCADKGEGRIPEAATRRQVLVDNPEKLYGFSAARAADDIEVAAEALGRPAARHS